MLLKIGCVFGWSGPGTKYGIIYIFYHTLLEALSLDGYSQTCIK